MDTVLINVSLRLFQINNLMKQRLPLQLRHGILMHHRLKQPIQVLQTLAFTLVKKAMPLNCSINTSNKLGIILTRSLESLPQMRVYSVFNPIHSLRRSCKHCKPSCLNLVSPNWLPIFTVAGRLMHRLDNIPAFTRPMQLKEDLRRLPWCCVVSTSCRVK